MGTRAQTLWFCLLGYIIHTATGAVNSPEAPIELAAVDKIGFSRIFCFPYLQPWRAGIFFNNTLNCSGALVHPQWVLTAAHCWQPAYTIGLGLQRISPPYEPDSQMIEANFSVKHPWFDLSSASVDLLLIKLSRPAMLSDTVSTIPIATRCAKARTLCLASGWGRLLDLQYPDDFHCGLVEVKSNKICRAAYKRRYKSTVFCAGGEGYTDGYTDTCRGDTGAPLVCRGVVQGIVPWSLPRCGQPGIPYLYTNICIFKCWINSIIQRN